MRELAKRKKPKKPKKMGPKPMAGSEAKLERLIAKVWEHKVMGYTNAEILDSITEEFKLPQRPHVATLYLWMKKGREILKEREAVKEDFMYGALEKLRRLDKKWMPIAEAQSLKVMRKRMEDGEIHHEINEEEVEEQERATKLVHNGIKIGAAILGVGRPTKEDESGNTGLQMTLIRNFNQIVMTPEQAKTTKQEVVLLLQGGDPDIEAIEGRSGEE